VNTMGEGIFQIRHLGWQPTLEMKYRPKQVRFLLKHYPATQLSLPFFLNATRFQSNQHSI